MPSASLATWFVHGSAWLPIPPSMSTTRLSFQHPQRPIKSCLMVTLLSARHLLHTFGPRGGPFLCHFESGPQFGFRCHLFVQRERSSLHKRRLSSTGNGDRVPAGQCHTAPLLDRQMRLQELGEVVRQVQFARSCPAERLQKVAEHRHSRSWRFNISEAKSLLPPNLHLLYQLWRYLD